MKKNLFLICAFLLCIQAVLYAQDCLKPYSTTPIFSAILYDSTYTGQCLKTDSVKEIGALFKASSGKKSVLYVNMGRKDTAFTRIYMLPDGRILQVSNKLNDTRYQVFIHYYDKKRFNASKVAECEINEFGKILFLVDSNHFDPNGKNAAVIYDKSWISTDPNWDWTINDRPVVFCNDLVVIRYQKLINELVPYLSNRKD